MVPKDERLRVYTDKLNAARQIVEEIHGDYHAFCYDYDLEVIKQIYAGIDKIKASFTSALASQETIGDKNGN